MREGGRDGEDPYYLFTSYRKVSWRPTERFSSPVTAPSSASVADAPALVLATLALGRSCK